MRLWAPSGRGPLDVAHVAIRQSRDCFGSLDRDEHGDTTSQEVAVVSLTHHRRAAVPGNLPTRLVAGDPPLCCLSADLVAGEPQ